MSEIRMIDGKAYCGDCGKDVHVEEKKAENYTAWKPYILVDDSGHVVAERATKAEPWESIGLLDRGTGIR